MTQALQAEPRNVSAKELATHDPEAFDNAYGGDDAAGLDEFGDPIAAEGNAPEDTQQTTPPSSAPTDGNTGAGQPPAARQPGEDQDQAALQRGTVPPDGTAKAGEQQTPASSAPPIPPPDSIGFRSTRPQTLEEVTKRWEASSREAHRIQEVNAKLLKLAQTQGLEVIDVDGEPAIVATEAYQKAAAADGKVAFRKLSDEDKDLASTDPEKFAEVLATAISKTQEKRLAPTAIGGPREPMPTEAQYAASWTSFVNAKDAGGQPTYPDAMQYSEHIYRALESLPKPVKEVVFRFPDLAYELGYYVVSAQLGPQEARRKAEQELTAKKARQTRPSSAAEGVGGADISMADAESNAAFIDRMTRAYNK